MKKRKITTINGFVFWLFILVGMGMVGFYSIISLNIEIDEAFNIPNIETNEIMTNPSKIALEIKQYQLYAGLLPTQKYEIDGYNIHVYPAYSLIVDNYTRYGGFVASLSNNTIFVENDTLTQMFITCNHEMCHLKLNVTDSKTEEAVCRQLENDLLYYSPCAKFLKILTNEYIVRSGGIPI